jgi:hypothetical protein
VHASQPLGEFGAHTEKSSFPEVCASIVERWQRGKMGSPSNSSSGGGLSRRPDSAPAVQAAGKFLTANS